MKTIDIYHTSITYVWNKSFSYVTNKLYTCVDRLSVYQEAIMIRDLYIEYDDGYFDILDSEYMWPVSKIMPLRIKYLIVCIT